MKTLITTILTFFLFSISLAETQINGNITNWEKIQSIQLKYSVEGYFLKEKEVALSISEKGLFSANIQIKQFGFAFLVFTTQTNIQKSIKLFLMPSENLSLKFDALNMDETLTFEGKYAKENQYLKKYNFEPLYGYSPLEQTFNEDTVAINCYKKVMLLKDSSLDKFLEEAKKQKFQKNFITFIQADLEAYYTLLFNYLSANQFHKKFRNKQNNNTFDNQNWGIQWKASIEKLQTSKLNFLGSYWYGELFSPFSNNYLWAYFYDLIPTDEEIKAMMKGEGGYQNRLLNKISEIFNGKKLELHFANFIYGKAFQHKYEKYLIPMFEQFKQKFPQSLFIDLLDKEIALIIAFNKTEVQEKTNEIHIIENFSQLNTLAEIIKPFYGKVVLIDLWGTWCGPCKSEFQYLPELKKRFEDKNLEYLYIASEKEGEEAETFWRKMIQFYKLKGFHAIGNKQLLKDIFYQIGQISKDEYAQLTDENKETVDGIQKGKGKLQSYPSYLLINTKGELVIRYAQKPSTKELLYQQIDKLLNE